MALLVFFAFLSGIVTILSPCILPVLPLVLSGSVGGKSKPWGVILGFTGSFSLFTLILSALVETLSLPPDGLRFFAVLLITLFGATLLFPSLQNRLELLLSRLIKIRGSSSRTGFRGGLLTGMSLGLLWTPCVGPIMASVITLAVSRRVDGGAVLIILAYSLGTSLPMFALMKGGRALLNRFPRLSSRTGTLQRIFGLVMIATGLLIATGTDRKFQSFVLEAFPRYGSGLISLENIAPVREALDKRKGASATETRFRWSDPPEKGRTGDYGRAPELIAEGPWINRKEPLSLDDLEGKVVLVDFWTYSCINCVRTIPYLKEWYDRYSDRGLEIIGVHSPEFPFERNVANVEKAVRDLGISWPVVLDNSFAQWNAYGNRYWPAHFFLDGTGQVRYFHFGEGDYGEAERVIVSLLEEAGYDSGKKVINGDTAETADHTPETYLGYKRVNGFTGESYPRDTPTLFQFSETPRPGEWSLRGEWTIRNDFIETSGDGELRMRFTGRSAFLVLEPLDVNSEIILDIDGLPGDTADVISGSLSPDRSGLYRLMEVSESSEHLMTLKVNGSVRLYTFTFG